MYNYKDIYNNLIIEFRDTCIYSALCLFIAVFPSQTWKYNRVKSQEPECEPVWLSFWGKLVVQTFISLVMYISYNPNLPVYFLC